MVTTDEIVRPSTSHQIRIWSSAGPETSSRRSGNRRLALGVHPHWGRSTSATSFFGASMQ